MVTTLTAGLVQLSAEVLAPKKALTPSQNAVVEQYSNAPDANLVEADVKAEIVNMLCELPRETDGISQSSCR